MLGGTLTVTSTPQQGSTFTLLISNNPSPTAAAPVIPWAPDSVIAASRVSPPPPSPVLAGAVERLAGVEVLIVDDDVRNVFALTSALEIRALSVHYADNGHDAIRLVTDRPEINIVLMDVMMPDLDGNETTRKIRALPHGRELPIVFLTAKAAPEDRDAALAAGATDYLTKPVDLDHLLEAMAHALPAQPPPSGPTTNAGESADRIDQTTPR
jgi:CheY-like chemotaxis protein